MGNHRRNTGFFPIGLKDLDLFFCIRFGGPPARRLGEDLNSGAINGLAEQQRFVDAAGNGHMGAQERAGWFLLVYHNILNDLNYLNGLNHGGTPPAFKPFQTFNPFKWFAL
jgi:hypothetical protein